MENEEYILKDECYKVIGCCMNVHNELGPGFLEPVYQEALSYELTEKRVPHEKEMLLKISYKEIILDKNYKADFVCFGELIVELKALKNLTKEHTSQVLNYLKASGYRIGLLINFGTNKLQYKRIIL